MPGPEQKKLVSNIAMTLEKTIYSVKIEGTQYSGSSFWYSYSANVSNLFAQITLVLKMLVAGQMSSPLPVQGLICVTHLYNTKLTSRKANLKV